MDVKFARLLAAIGVALMSSAALAWSGVAAAQPYRPGEFLNLDLSKAVLSPWPLGPATSFTPGPLDVTLDRGSNSAQANAELVVDPKAVPAEPVPAETVRAESKSAASGALASRPAAPATRVAHVRTGRPAPRRPRALVALHGRNPIEARAEDTEIRAEIHSGVRTPGRARIQVWPCRSGGICNWKR
jgi:hypothetical protein